MEAPLRGLSSLPEMSFGVDGMRSLRGLGAWTGLRSSGDGLRKKDGSFLAGLRGGGWMISPSTGERGDGVLDASFLRMVRLRGTSAFAVNLLSWWPLLLSLGSLLELS